MLVLHTQSEVETSRFAADLALALRPGDLVLVSGDLGTGKTVLCRSLIRKLADDPELEVPSPTYTICQTYEGRFPVAHFDLYRLSGLEELEELGWEEFLETGIALMEWPQNCFDVLPENSVLLEIVSGVDNERSISLSGNLNLIERIQRSLEIRDFLSRSGLPVAERQFLLGDASVRSYETVNGETILMNSPEMPDGPIVKDGKPYSKIAHLAENVTAFVAIDQLLRQQGFRAPNILSRDLDQGLLLTEHFGSDGIIDAERRPIKDRYLAAVEVLAELHMRQIDASVPLKEGIEYQIARYDREAMLAEVDLLVQWYLPHFGSGNADTTKFFDVWNGLIDELESHPTSLVLRDYHSPNILWNEQGAGVDRIGIIDFQDAVIGPQSYDVASLAQDARVDVSNALETEIVNHYVKVRQQKDTDFDQKQFEAGYAIMAAQRATKVIGIFVRLNLRDNKPAYLAHLPRAKNYLARALKHPILEQYRNWIANVIEV